MIDPDSFQGLQLCGGFVITRLEFVREPMIDPIGRAALAKTKIAGRNLSLTILSGLNDNETSVTLYHEILEAMAVASSNPPASVRNFNEGDFEQAGYKAHEQFGPASPERVNSMLKFYGFLEQ